jgi:hypothetical protein
VKKSYFICLLFAAIALSSCGSFTDSNSHSSNPSSSDDSESTSDEVLYTITWKNYDDAILEVDADVSYGVTPSYDGDIPTKPESEIYTYTFNGWSPSVISVSDDATYVAQYDEVINTYTITWKNYDDTTLEVDNDVPHGATPSYDGDTPTKPESGNYTYTFNGWSPSVISVTGDATYVAQYDADTRKVLTYTEYDNYVVITGVTSTSSVTEIIIPNIINDKRVTSIGDFAFSSCTALVTTTIPDSVTSIGGFVFSGCTALASIVIPGGVTSIDGFIFMNCNHVIIYCVATSKPGGWNALWNSSNRPVYWGGTWHYDSGTPVPNS